MPGATAFTTDPLTADDRGAVERYLRLTNDLGRCRYFTAEERSVSLRMTDGVEASFEMTLPDAGATRDMLGLLRQLFGDKERASFASMLALLRAHANGNTPEGRELLDVVERFELLKQGVLDGWDVLSRGDQNLPPPLVVFLDWMYGEYLHSDADKAQRIKELNGSGVYHWQFHWVTERLAKLFVRLTEVVRPLLDLAEKQ